MAYTGYSTRFFFRFASLAGREFRIDIKKYGYTGTAQQRPLGQTPVLKRESGDNGVHGTSLEIYAVCKTDGEFAELYTSSANEFLVVLSEVSGGTTTALWHGFITPELYAEPEVAPPYDVQIVATDGLGELKLYDFVAAGRVSLYTHLYNLLSTTGLDANQSDIVMVNSLECTTPSVSAANLLTGIYVDLDHLVGKGTQYDALVGILASLHMSITRFADKWLLYRDSDIVVSDGLIAANNAAGTSVSLPVAQYGSMKTHLWYPVGRMETDIEPAKNEISVAFPFQTKESMFENPNLPDGTGWTYPTQQPNVDHYVQWIEIGGGERRPMLFNTYTSGSCTIYQDINVEAYDGKLTLRILTMLFGELSAQTYSVFFKLKLTASGATYYLKKKELGDVYEWVTSDNQVEYKAERLSGYTGSRQIPVSAFNENSFGIPGLPAAGTLRIEITSKSKNFWLGYKDQDFYLGGVFLLQDSVPGYKDAVVIDNDARGSDNEVVIEFGDTQFVPNALKNFLNVTSNSSGVACSEWATSKFSGEFLSVMAMDYALGAALPRLNAKGKLNVPSSAQLPMAFVNPDGITMLLLESSWRILEDNLEVQMRSVPAATLTITSETITELSEEEAEAAGGTDGSSSGGSGGGGGGSTGSRYFEDVLDDTTGELVGAKALYNLYIIQTPADEEQLIPEVKKDITEILRHLSLQVVNEGTANEQTVLVTDLTFASQKNLVSGGVGGGGSTPTGGSIATLNDVSLSVLSGGDTLVYNAQSSHWENKPLLLANLGDVSGAPSNGQTLVWDSISGKWMPGNMAPGGVTSIGISVPTGFAVTGSPVTSSGTIAISFASGYSLPTTHKQEHWDSAYTDSHTHSNKSVLDGITSTDVSHWGTAYSASHTHNNKSVLDGISSSAVSHWDDAYSAMGKADYNSSNAALATQTWVGNQGYITSSAISDMATKTWVGQQGYLTSADLSGYATQSWVEGKGYVTSSAISDMATETWVNNYFLPLTGGKLTGDLRLQSGSYGLTLYFGDGAYTYISEPSDDAMTIYARNGITMLTASTGTAVYVGNSNSAIPMVVWGTLEAFGNTTIGTSSANKKLTVYGSTSAALTIYGGSYSTNIYRDSSYLNISASVKVSGNLVATGNVTSGTASDRRLKKDIRDIKLDDAETVLARLHPVQFEWNDDAARLGRLFGVSRGFLADEYLKLLPNAGRKIWGDYDAIEYEQTIPYLVAGWQRQNLRIRILEGDMKALKEENEHLRRRLREYVN